MAAYLTNLGTLMIIGAGFTFTLVFVYAAVCAMRGSWEELKDDMSDQAAVESLVRQVRRGPREQLSLDELKEHEAVRRG